MEESYRSSGSTQSLAWKLMKRQNSRHVGSFVLGNKHHITRQESATARRKTPWGNTQYSHVRGVNYIKNTTEHRNCCSYPAGDFGGTALDPTGPWPALDCMFMASILATGAGPRPRTHSDTLWLSHTVANIQLYLNHYKKKIHLKAQYVISDARGL